MNVFIDIETIPEQNPNMDDYRKLVKAPGNMKKQEAIDKWLSENLDDEAEKLWLKTSFDGGKGQIICICASVGGEVWNFHSDNEASLLHGFNAFMNDIQPFEHATTAIKFVGHNVRQFDLPFLRKRMVINQVKPSFKTTWHGRHGLHCFDTMEEWAGFGGRISQDNLAKILGIESSKGKMDGSQVWPEFQKGNIGKIAEYCADDVRCLIEIYNRLTWA